MRFTFSSKEKTIFPTSVWNRPPFNCGCTCSIQETGSISVHAWRLCALILAFEHFSHHSRSGRLSTSLILQFAGWNSRPCLSRPPPNNGKPLSTSYWPTTWLIKTALESRCQLTLKPIKPQVCHLGCESDVWLREQRHNFSLSWGRGCILAMVNATSSISTRHWDQALVNSYTCLHGSNALCYMTFYIYNWEFLHVCCGWSTAASFFFFFK